MKFLRQFHPMFLGMAASLPFCWLSSLIAYYYPKTPHSFHTTVAINGSFTILVFLGLIFTRRLPKY